MKTKILLCLIAISVCNFGYSQLGPLGAVPVVGSSPFTLSNTAWYRGGNNGINPTTGTVNTNNIFGTGPLFNSPIYFETFGVIRGAWMGTIGPVPGALGIGTITPQQRLHVSDGLINTFIQVQNTGTTAGGVIFQGGGLGAKQVIIHSTGPGNFQGTGKFVFRADSIDHLTIDLRGLINGATYGYTGIGLSFGLFNPQSRLQLFEPTAKGVFCQWTNTTTGNIAPNDGFKVGIDALGNAQIIQQENNLPTQFLIQDVTLGAQGALKSIIEKSFSDIISQNLIQLIANYLTQNKTDTPYTRHLIHIRKNLFSYTLKHRIQFLVELKTMH